MFQLDRALEQLSCAFAGVRKATKQARDVAYIHALAAAAGLSVKEYQRLLEMFNRIDQDKVGWDLDYLWATRNQDAHRKVIQLCQENVLNFIHSDEIFDRTEEGFQWMCLRTGDQNNK